MSLELSKVVLLLFILLAVSENGLRKAGAKNVEDYRTALPIRAVRILEEDQNSTQSALTIRTERVDPLNDLKKYRGGYNITNKHYWSSTIFTGKYGYIIAALWLVAGLIYATILVVATLCCSKRRRRRRRQIEIVDPRDRNYRLWPVAFAVLFTLLAIIASGVALGGSTRVNSRAKTTKNIIVGAASNASGTIYSVTGAVRAMQSDPQVYVALDGSNRLNSTMQRLEEEADNIEHKALKNMRLLNKGLKILNVVTIVTVSLNLAAVLALLVTPFLRLRRVSRTLIVLCWALTSLFWLYFGLYYFLNKFVGDTCAALDEFRQDPRNSTLSSILPCNNQASSRRALLYVGKGIHNVIDQVNGNISGLQSSSSLPGVGYVCNPFLGPPDYTYQPDNCSSGTIQIRNIPNVLKMYTCLNDTCAQGEFIPASIYSTAVLYTTSVQDILDAYPGMESLVDCQLVKDAFSKILSEECPPLKKYVHMTWAGFAALATVMAVLLLTSGVARRKRRSYDRSVKPHSSPTDTSDVDAPHEMASKRLEMTMEA